LIQLTVFGAIAAFVWIVVGPLTFRYDAEFDFVKERLDRHPNVTVVDSWRHEDVTLEDFGFFVRTRPGGYRFELRFTDGTDKLAVFEKADGAMFYRGETPVWGIDFNQPGPGQGIENMDQFLLEAETLLGAYGELPTEAQTVPKVTGNIIQVELGRPGR
jgi:hypothetical protein